MSFNFNGQVLTLTPSNYIIRVTRLFYRFSCDLLNRDLEHPNQNELELGYFRVKMK